MPSLILKASLIWCLLVIAAMMNGLLREYVLNPALGPTVALPLSGLSLSLLILALSWLCMPFFGNRSANDDWRIGAIWVALTLAFELPFGHYVMGTSWEDIFSVFNLSEGNLFLLVLLVTFIAPRLMAGKRSRIKER